MTVDRSVLPATFGPWFSRFPGLTEVQRRAIPPIASGRDVLICSATSSGKTEAYAAPAAELARRCGRASAAVLIVCPTRALANDLKRRLEGPMGLVDVPLGRYTGEHKELVGGGLPAVVITTPESLDSMLARRPDALRQARMVIVDEVHVLDGTPRGDQLRILLHRLGLVTGTCPQRIAASATVDRPGELAGRYLDDAELVVVPGLRNILGRAFEGNSAPRMAQHLDDLAGHGFKKILVFCRSRNLVETLSAKLLNRTRFGAEIFAHHGSLAKNVRERNERLFHQASAGVCFATLTLELGIDIGTVDYVLLASVPADVCSLLQRVGRGGRRGDTTRCGYVVESAAEAHLFRTMFRLGKEGRLCGAPYGFRPSVLVQQALVLACSGAYLVRADLERLVPASILSELGSDACGALLEGMVEAGLLERSGADRFVPSEAIEERYRYGSLHSNIDDQPDVAVIDRLTGDTVGSVLGVDTRRIELGGRERDIVRSVEGRLLTDAGRGARPARFRPSASPSVSLALGRAVVEALGVKDGHLGVVAADGRTVLLHGLGTVGALFLVEVLRRAKLGEPADPGPYTVALPRPPSEVPGPHADAVTPFLEDRLAALSKLVSAGPWEHGVPDTLRASSVRRMTGLDEIAAFLATARLQPIEEPGEGLLAVLGDL